MIIYATKLAYDRLHIKPSETLHYAADHLYPQLDYINSVKQKETWSEIFEWYADLFYFDKEKYLRTIHIGSGFTLFFGKVDEAFMYGLGFRIKKELYKYFQNDAETSKLLDLFYADSFLNFYSRITDKKRMGVFKSQVNTFNIKHPLFKSCIIDGKPCLDSLMKAVNSEQLYNYSENNHSASQLFIEQLNRRYGKKQTIV